MHCFGGWRAGPKGMVAIDTTQTRDDFWVMPAIPERAGAAHFHRATRLLDFGIGLGLPDEVGVGVAVRQWREQVSSFAFRQTA